MSNLLAVVTGASSGIGYELARLCAENGYDLIVAADEAEIEDAASRLRLLGAQVTAIQADLATAVGCDALLGAVDAVGRPIDALLANAGRGLGHGFLDQDLEEAIRVVDTNITGTLWITQKIGRAMRERGSGRILFTGSIAGLMPGTFQAVYNGTKAFIDSFSVALRHELADKGVTVTCLMPGVTDTEFFRRAGMLDTQVGQTEHKADPADVARTGFDAMTRGESSVVHGMKNKVQAAMTNVLSDDALAERHRKMAEPGSAHS